jgi:hypothetical protein
MSEDVLLKAHGVEITTKVARFGGISYQIANVSSVAVYVAKKFNPYAMALFTLGVAIGVWANQLNSQYSSDQALTVAAVALACIVAAVVVQVIWPKLVSTLVLKASSDVQKLQSNDVDHIYAVHRAVDEAFVRRSLTE